MTRAIDTAYFAERLRRRRAVLLSRDVCRTGSRVREVERALERIELDQYGECQYCRRPMDPDRLHATPCAAVCAWCERAVRSAS